MSNLMLDVDQAGELKAAFRRGDWTNAQIKKLCESNLLTKLLLVLEGRAEIVTKSILTFVKSIATSMVVGKKTTECFQNKSRYCWRDADLDRWLPETQQGHAGSNFFVQKLTQAATLKEVVESFLGRTGDIKTLALLLRERGVVTTLPVIESLIERQESGEDVSLNTRGRANLFFVDNNNEQEDEDGSVSVVYMSRYGGQWSVFVFCLGNDNVWRDGYRFFFHN